MVGFGATILGFAITGSYVLGNILANYRERLYAEKYADGREA